jgi:hypothetical protein
VQIERIADGQDQRLSVTLDRENHVAVDQLDGELPKDFRVGRGLGQIDHIHAESLPDSPQRTLFAIESQFARNLVQAAVLGLRFTRNLQLSGVQGALFAGGLG